MSKPFNSNFFRFAIAILVYFFQSGMVFGQLTGFPAGGYMNLEELKNKTPSLPYDYEVTKRSREDIKLDGGVDYTVISGTQQPSFVKKELYAVSTGDTLYLNCQMFKKQFGFSRVLVEGHFMAFEVGDFEKKRNKTIAIAIMFGPIIAGIAAAENALTRELIVLDTETGKTNVLDTQWMLDHLSAFPELMSQYELVESKGSKFILLRYLTLLNLNY